MIQPPTWRGRPTFTVCSCLQSSYPSFECPTAFPVSHADICPHSSFLSSSHQLPHLATPIPHSIHTTANRLGTRTRSNASPTHPLLRLAGCPQRRRLQTRQGGTRSARQRPSTHLSSADPLAPSWGTPPNEAMCTDRWRGHCSRTTPWRWLTKWMTATAAHPLGQRSDARSNDGQRCPRSGSPEQKWHSVPVSRPMIAHLVISHHRPSPSPLASSRGPRRPQQSTSPAHPRPRRCVSCVLQTSPPTTLPHAHAHVLTRTDHLLQASPPFPQTDAPRSSSSGAHLAAMSSSPPSARLPPIACTTASRYRATARYSKTRCRHSVSHFAPPVTPPRGVTRPTITVS